MRIVKWVLACCILMGAMVGIALAVQLPTSPYLDFRVLYFADKGILTGVPLYNPQAQAEMIAPLLNTAPQKVIVIPFPYLPWLALGTLYLGLFPIHAALTLWTELNLLMLVTAVFLLTASWNPRARLLALPAALFFIPVLGNLAVGQYDVPIFLGVSMLVYGLQREKVWLSAAGMWLAAIKPHLGALVFLFALIYLFQKKDEFSRQTLRAIFFFGAALFLLGFAADSAWLVNYPKALIAYRGQTHITTCSECASLPVFLARWLFDGSLARAAEIAALLLLILFVLAFWLRSELFKSPQHLIASALLLTLLSSPYLYNYDFILLLIPLALLYKTSQGFYHRVLLAGCYLLPTLAIIFWGRAGNGALILTAAALTVMLYGYVKMKDTQRILYKT